MLKAFGFFKEFRKMIVCQIGLLSIQSVLTFLSIYWTIGSNNATLSQTLALMILSLTTGSTVLLAWVFFRENNDFLLLVIWVATLIVQLIFSNFIYVTASFLILYFNWNTVSDMMASHSGLLWRHKLLVGLAIMLVSFSALFRYVMIMV